MAIKARRLNETNRSFRGRTLRHPREEADKNSGRRPRESLLARRPARLRRDRLIRREQIQAYCDAIAQEFRPQRIVLFGSYAYGRPTPDSDVDLLVILPFRGNAVAKAIQIRARFDTPFPLDLMVRQPEFIARRLRERDMFIEMVTNRGQVIYESEHP